MSKANDVVRLRHMLDAARKAAELTENSRRADLDKDEKLALALIRLLEILGEAAKSVSEQCQQEYSEIPWRQIAGTRDRLIHGYFDVDLDIVWKIVSCDLPTLMQQLEKALSDEN
jgi:uncharacterized protein with HEPN domain